MSDFLVVQEQGGLLEVRLNRPEKYNALSAAMVDGLRRAVELFANRGDLKILLLTASGKYFCSGAEISPEMSPPEGSSPLQGRAWHRNSWHRLFDDLEAIEKPVIAAHQGPCLGGGLELSLACDFRLAAQSAFYGLPEPTVGVLPASGGISRLVHFVGPSWARWMVMAGQQVGAEQALQIGLVQQVFPDAEFQAGVRAFCQTLAAQPTEVLGLAKLAIKLAQDLGQGQGRDLERICSSLLMSGAEHKLLIDAFLERQVAKRLAKTS